MSSTNRGAKRAELDAYQTPVWCVDLLISLIDWSKVRSFLEPCRGTGTIYHNVPCADTHTHMYWCEISAGRDYLATRFPEMLDLIITNPPFSLAMKFLGKSLGEAETVIYLLRLNMLGGQCRREFWNARPPAHIFPLAKRPSFTGRGTDSCDYAWFVWGGGKLITTTRPIVVL